MNILISRLYGVLNLNNFYNFSENRRTRPPEDNADLSKHVGVLTILYTITLRNFVVPTRSVW